MGLFLGLFCHKPVFNWVFLGLFVFLIPINARSSIKRHETASNSYSVQYQVFSVRFWRF